MYTHSEEEDDEKERGWVHRQIIVLVVVFC